MLHYVAETRSVEVIAKQIIPIGTFEWLGHGLALFFDSLAEILAKYNVDVYVREKAVITHMADTDRLFRIGGVSDVALWEVRQTGFFDITPSSVKKIITGNGRARKDEVAKCLAPYVGEQTYMTNDESDAIAVGVAFLIKEGYLDEKRDTLSDG